MAAEVEAILFRVPLAEVAAHASQHQGSQTWSTLARHLGCLQLVRMGAEINVWSILLQNWCTWHWVTEDCHMIYWICFCFHLFVCLFFPVINGITWRLKGNLKIHLNDLQGNVNYFSKSASSFHHNLVSRQMKRRIVMHWYLHTKLFILIGI